jgi:hypothetical protein
MSFNNDLFTPRFPCPEPVEGPTLPLGLVEDPDSPDALPEKPRWVRVAAMILAALLALMALPVGF